MLAYHGKVMVYHTITYTMVLFVLTISVLCSFVAPWTVPAGFVMCIFFLMHRHGTNLALCKDRWLRQASKEAKTKEKNDEEELNKAQKQMVENARLDTIAVEMSGICYCKTCGYPYTPNWETNPTCTATGVPTHHVKDEPVAPNHFAWWWFQMKGYEPPNFAPTTVCNPFEHKGWAADDPVEAMKQAGKAYYMKHANHAWDLGYGDVPTWYYLK